MLQQVAKLVETLHLVGALINLPIISHAAAPLPSPPDFLL